MVRSFLPLRAAAVVVGTVATLLVPVAPAAAQPDGTSAGQQGDDPVKPPPPPPGPPEEARHPEPKRQPVRGKPPAAALADKRGPDASVAGLAEVEDLRGATARFFADEGHEAHVVQLYTEPINYRDEKGNWRPIDNSVVPVDGGYTNAANSFDVFFPGTIGPTRPVTLTYPEGALSFSLVGSAPATGSAAQQSVVYPDVLPQVDLAFDVMSDGIKERAVLRSPDAPARLRYRIRTDGLELESAADGSIGMFRGDDPVAYIPASYAYDSSDDERSEPATTYDIGTSLREQGPGEYLLDLEIPREWLESPERVYPVTLDPPVVSTHCSTFPAECPINEGIPLIKDTYVRQGISDRRDSAPLLKVDRTSGSEARIFMTFDLRQEVRKVGDLIYDAKFDLFTEGSAASQFSRLEMRRITHDWDAATTWTYNRPDVDPKVWATDDGCGDVNCKEGWARWDVPELVQYWIDTHVPTNHGWEISMNPGSPNVWKEYASGDAADPWRRPYVNVWVNALPGTKPFAMDDPDWPKLELAPDALPDQTVLETTSPKLEIKDLIDKNGDEIIVRYQVSKYPGTTSGQSFASGIEYDSGWIAETHTHRVPPGYLSDGTHYWRVQAGDVCAEKYRDPDEPELAPGRFVCDDLGDHLTRANGPHSERPTSPVRSFTIVSGPKQIGKDPRWAMWSKGLGNGMQLSVNQSNGNAIFEYPIDSLGTAQAPVQVRLTHNTQQAMQAKIGRAERAPGLPPGWELAAGPAADPQQMPVRLKPLSYVTSTGTSVTYAVAVTYESGKRDVFAEASGGLFTQAGPLAATVRRTSDGWILNTYSGGTYAFSFSGTLVRARPSSATATAPGFTYEFDNGRLKSLVDPVGRKLSFTYAAVSGATGTMLEKIVAFDDVTDPTKKLTWTVEYADGEVASITDPDLAEIEIAYDDQARLARIYDGVEATKENGSPTIVEYSTTTFGADRAVASKIFLPKISTVAVAESRDAGDPHALGSHDTAWEFAYETASSTSDFSRKTTVVSPRGRLTGDANDFKVMTDFNDVGLPIMRTGPRVDGDFSGWPVTKKVWDFNTGNLICHRGPAANTVNDVDCGASDGLQTQYEYQPRPPFLLTKVTESADTANGPRLVTTYAYDDAFRGLQTHYYENNALTGLPDAVDISPRIFASWGDGGPSQLTEDPSPSEFSVRYFGEWVPPEANEPKNYEFRITAEDDARLLVGSDVLVDCISSGVARVCSGTTQNTGTAKSVGQGPVRIAVELRAITGPAHVKLEWKRADGQFEVVPESALRPATDALTSEKVGTVLDPGAYSTRMYDYAHSEAKVRRLPTAVTVSGGSKTPDTVARSISYTYDDHGRVKRETDATGLPVIHDYEQDGPCETKTTDRIGLVSERTCNLAGDVTTQTDHVAGVLVNGSDVVDDRTTTTTYTNLGRVDRVTFADGGYVDNDYDLAGRLIKETVLEAAGVTRVTDYVRNAQGWVTEERLPDPDGAGPTPRPVIEYRYDQEGNAIVREDPRDKRWIEEFDAFNRVVERRDARGNKWTFKYDVAGVRRKKIDPHDVVVTFTYDALNRLKSTVLGNLPASTTTYDLRGLVESQTDPDGLTTSFKVDAHGNVLRETQPFPVGSRTFVYDGSGFLTEERSFRGNVTLYDYDDMGHLESVTAPGGFKTQYTLNDAGEVEVTRLPGETEATGSWQFDYDKMGRVTREIDAAAGVRTAAYNKAGEPVATTDGGLFRIEHVYDRLGQEDQRLAYRIGESGNPDSLVEVMDFGYDAAGNMTAATNDEGTIVADYDEAGRLSAVQAEGKTTTFVYEGSRLSSRTDAAGTTTYRYEDGTGRIRSLSGPLAATTTRFDYKPSGRLWHEYEIETVDGTEVTTLSTTYHYDAAGRMDEKKVRDEERDETVAIFSSGYNADSQVTSRTRTIRDETLSGPDDGTWAYTYDGRGLLDTATAPDGVVFDYDYDGAGNRTVVTEKKSGTVETTTTTTTTYVGSRPQKSTKKISVNGLPGAPVETTYQHDRAGNLSRIDGPAEWRSFTYDEWGQMQTASKGVPAEAAVTEHVYNYDALGRTVQKATSVREAGVETDLIRELFWQAGLSDELVESSLIGPSTVGDTETIVTSYGYHAGTPHSVRRVVTTEDPQTSTETTLNLLGTDPHGDVVYSMNRDHELEGIQSYDPWGTLRSDVGDKTHLGFQSDHADWDVGVVDMGARYYLPELGRFITQDTYAGVPAVPLTQNRFVYGLNDPVSNVDPTGRYSNKATGGGTCGGCTRGEEAEASGSEEGKFTNYIALTEARLERMRYPLTRFHIVHYTSDGRPWGAPPPPSSGSSWFSFALDVVGLVPIVGDAVDGLRCGVETLGGNATVDTAFTCAAILPGAGWAAFGAKTGRRIADVASATRGATSAANAARLARQLEFDEAAAIFTRSGGLQDEVIGASRQIISGSGLGNPSVIKALTADGSNIAQWGKYVTPTFRSPSGPFQVHFYYNPVTGGVNYAWDYKSVFTGR